MQLRLCLLNHATTLTHYTILGHDRRNSNRERLMIMMTDGHPWQSAGHYFCYTSNTSCSGTIVK